VYIFGVEPADPEIYEFVLSHYQELKFGEPREFVLEIKRMNPKRVQREIRREMERIKETTKPSTFAQDCIREELEKKKVQKKQLSSAKIQARKKEQFVIKQRKKKEKKKGH